MTGRPRQPPRLVMRALVASFLTVALVLTTVFFLFSLDVRRRTRESVMRNLAASQQVFTGIEARRQKELTAAVSTLAENPTLKAALDTWQTERNTGGAVATELLDTVRREVAKLATLVHAQVLAVVDTNGSVVVGAGPRASAWPPGRTRVLHDHGVDGGSNGSDAATDTVAMLPDGVFRVRGAPLVLSDAVIGSLELGTALDNEYARDLANLARAESAIVIDGRVHATTLPNALAADLERLVKTNPELPANIELGGEHWAVQRVGGMGGAAFLALASIDAAAATSTRSALAGLAWIGLAALALAAGGSLWLARALTGPIDRLSGSLSDMTEARRFDMPVPATGTSRELDALAGTFNELIRALAQAEAETQAAYLGAIRALAAALDARDPYTSGHSERVSAVSVEMGRAMNLSEQDISTLRLGALLHDIGKIGVPDEVLRKPAALTPAEFELIRAHPVIGARILRSIPFLVAHLPIVELHHERPDGHGYPYGLVADAIPLAARIVHVADAFDAMTSARAYRPGRLPHEAVAELQRCSGTDFDPQSVEALVTALPRLPAAFAAFDPTAFQLVAFQRSKVS